LNLVLGSRNAHKRRELDALLAPHQLSALPARIQLPPENGVSFTENALLKARATAQATGREALGEDSGIVVPALGGAPGIRSARYAGEQATDEQNVSKLLRELESVEDRRAAYACALVFVAPDGEEKIFEAECHGRIARAPRGSGGFGYDPIFVPDEGSGDVTMASLAPDEKNAISHRGRAARLLREWLSAR
jgi:XTP/dITP diphosphohydrolase